MKRLTARVPTPPGALSAPAPASGLPALAPGRRVLAAGLSALALAAGLALPAAALDVPHGADNGMDCISCHQGHNAGGMGLTTPEGNANLCLSCHQIAQVQVPAFLEADQADLFARRGFHHRWDSGTGGYTTPTVTAGGSTGALRSGDQGAGYTGSGLKTYTVTVSTSGGAGTATLSWTATGGLGGSGTLTCGADVALNEGITVTCVAPPSGALGPCGAAFCAGDAWKIQVTDVPGTPSHAALLARMPDGKVVCSTCHDQHSQAVASFTSETVAGNPWRHFMRLPNDAGQLCRQCHADRFPVTLDPNFPFDHTRSHTGGARSHPVQVSLGLNGRGYDRAEPLDADGSPQSTGDGVASNDLLLTPAGEVVCLTCHGVHGGAADGNGRSE